MFSGRCDVGWGGGWEVWGEPVVFTLTFTLYLGGGLM